MAIGVHIMHKIFKGRCISQGVAVGEAIVSKNALSFFGNININTGIIEDKSNFLYKSSVAGKILVMSHSKGSTASTWAICRLKENESAPAAIIIGKADTILISGAIIAKIPCVDNFEFDPTEKLKTGQTVKVNGTKGTIELIE
jgi:uncharacterized protein